MDRLVSESIAPTTARLYRRVVDKLNTFCAAHQLKDKFSPRTVELFVASLNREGLGPGAIQSSLSALRHYCKSRGIAMDFDTPKLGLVLRGIKRTHTPSQSCTSAVSISVLRKLCKAAPLCFDRQFGFMLRALFSLSFFGLLRPSEACKSPSSPCHQVLSNQTKIKGNRLRIMFRSYKHSQAPVRVTVLAQDDKTVCPVSLLNCYMDKADFGLSDALFPITTSEFCSALNKCLMFCGISRKFTPHSFRRGGATFYSAGGMSDACLRAMGRWKSNAYLVYVKPK